MSDLSIYLGGPVEHKADGGESWRHAITEAYHDLNLSFQNPLAKYNVPATDVTIVSEDAGDNEVTPKDIVDADKDLLRNSDAVLVGYSAVRSIGTPMEVMWAYERSKPVVIWIRDGTSIDDLSPWYRYHADSIHHTAEGAIRALQSGSDKQRDAA